MRFRVAAAAVLSITVAGHALAHAIIVDSVPAPLAHVPAGQLAIALRYNSRIDAQRSKLVLRHGDDEQRLTAEAATPDVLAAGVKLIPGKYVIVWQVLATDGHITHGTIPFTVDAAASAPGASATR